MKRWRRHCRPACRASELVKVRDDEHLCPAGRAEDERQPVIQLERLSAGNYGRYVEIGTSDFSTTLLLV